MNWQKKHCLDEYEIIIADHCYEMIKNIYMQLEAKFTKTHKAIEMEENFHNFL